MNPRLLEIQKERQEQMLVIQQALAHVATLDQEENEILSGDQHIEQIDFFMFKGRTSRLLEELSKSPNRRLSHDDIRIDVMLNVDADIRELRKTICVANQELENTNSIYEINNIKGYGYQLALKKTLPNVTCHPKKSGKTSKMVSKKGNVRQR